MKKKSNPSVDNKEHIDFLANICKDIFAIKVKELKTIKKCYNEFYKVMRKYGIKQGTRIDAGVQMSNPEWVICRVLFKDRINMSQDWEFLKYSFSAPDDLKCY